MRRYQIVRLGPDQWWVLDTETVEGDEFKRLSVSTTKKTAEILCMQYEIQWRLEANC